MKYSWRVIGGALLGCVMLLTIGEMAHQWHISRMGQRTHAIATSTAGEETGTAGSLAPAAGTNRINSAGMAGAPPPSADQRPVSADGPGSSPTAAAGTEANDPGSQAQLLPGVPLPPGFTDTDRHPARGPRGDSVSAPSVMMGGSRVFSGVTMPGGAGAERATDAAGAPLNVTSSATPPPAPAPVPAEPSVPAPSSPGPPSSTPPPAPSGSVPPPPPPPSGSVPPSVPSGSAPPTPPPAPPAAGPVGSATPPPDSTGPSASSPTGIVAPGVPGSPAVPPAAPPAPPSGSFFGAPSAPAPDPFGPASGPSSGLSGDSGAAGAAGLTAGDVSPTPEPGSMLLIGSGLVGILGALRKRRLL